MLKNLRGSIKKEKKKRKLLKALLALFLKATGIDKIKYMTNHSLHIVQGLKNWEPTNNVTHFSDVNDFGIQAC